MMKSLSLTLVLSIVDLSEASRSPTADAVPLAGTQMIQLKAAADVGDSYTGARWSITYLDQPISCVENTGNVLTWNAGGETAEECMQACDSWGDKTVNQNSGRTCSAGHLYQDSNGKKFCRLFEKCDRCRAQEFPGTTFQLGEPCLPQCQRSDCKRDQGFKPKRGFRDIPCALSPCTPHECCDDIPGWTTTTTTGVPVEFKWKPCRTAWALFVGHRCSDMFEVGISAHAAQAMQLLTDMEGTKLLTKVHWESSGAEPYSVEFSNDCKETAQNTRPKPPPSTNPRHQIDKMYPSTYDDSWWTCTWFGRIDNPEGGNLEFPKPVKARWAKLQANYTEGGYIRIWLEGSDL